MAKQPAVSTQLKTAQARIAELEKRLAEATRTKDCYYRERNDMQAELDQIHGILDAIPSAPARKYQTEDSYGTNERKLPARLAAYFAVRA